MVEVAENTFLNKKTIEASGGEVLGESALKRGVKGISTDSRKCKHGYMFIPIKGEKTDGHLYIRSALENGCVASLIGVDYFKKSRDEMLHLQKKYKNCFLIVKDPLTSLQRMAQEHLRGRNNLYTIGITGSNGKTTTKELIGAILGLAAPTAVSEGNLNSEIGLPLAAFGVRDEHKYAVFEMAMNRKGEMDILADIVRPDCALITNIGTAHIGYLKSQEAIALEKKKIFSCFNGSQKGFIHEEEPFFPILSEGVRGEIIPYGGKSTPGLKSYKHSGLNGTELRWQGQEILFPLPGKFNFRNCLGAIRLAVELGVDKSAIKEALESIKPLSGRGELFRGEVTIVKDCYNANMESSLEAVDFLDSISWKGRKIFVLGSMKELGEFTSWVHEKVGERIAVSGIDAVFFFGEETEICKRRWDERGRDFSFWYTSYEKLERAIVRFVKPGDLLYLKGSRAMELERLIDPLLK